MPAFLHTGQGALGELIVILRQAAEGNEGTVEGIVTRDGRVDVVGAGPFGCLCHGLKVFFCQGDGAFGERFE